jgi:WD40 repeat protein
VVAVPAITPTPGPTAAVAVPHDHALRLAWAPDGAALIASTEAGARIYDPASGNELALVPVAGTRCDVGAVSDFYLACIEAGGTAFRVFAWPDGDLVFEQRDVPAETFQSIAISPDGALLGVGERFQARMWTLPTGELTATFQTADLSDSYVTDVGFTTDGRTLVSVTQWEGRVHEWNTSTLALRRSFRIPTVTQFVLSPDTRILLADYATPGFERWDVAAGVLIDRHPTIIGAGGDGFTAISPNNRRVAVWGYKNGENNALGVWDISSDTLLAEFLAGPVLEHTWRSAAFSPDGNTLALGDTAGVIHLVETATWTEVGRVEVP